MAKKVHTKKKVVAKLSNQDIFSSGLYDLAVRKMLKKLSNRSIFERLSAKQKIRRQPFFGKESLGCRGGVIKVKAFSNK